MVHAPDHLAYVVVECAFVKVPWSSIIQGGWRPVETHECVDCTHSKSADLLITQLTSFRGWTTLSGGTWVQSKRSHFALLPCVIKSLPALPSVGVSASCRHVVSHFKPAMTILGAGLTPVVIRLPAVYPLTPLRSKISLCSVSVWEEKTLFYRALGVDVGLYSSYVLRM